MKPRRRTLSGSVFNSVSVLLLFIALESVVHALSLTNGVSRYNASFWQYEDGLPNNLVHGLVQTQDGYAWVATQDGLARFDGAGFVRGERIGITNHGAFTALHENREGSLWAGTASGQLIRRIHNRFSNIPLPDEFRGDSITALFQARDGTMWIGSASKGLAVFRNNKFERWTQTEGLPHDSVRAFCEDKTGAIWIATHGGLGLWEENKMTQLTVKDGLLHNSIRAMHVDREGHVWVGCAFGLTRIKATQFTHFTRKDGLVGDMVTSILEDREGQLWVGTFNGLNCLVEGKLVVEIPETGGSYERVNCLLEDREGGIWVGTRDGLSRLKRRVLHSFTRDDGLTYNHATSVFQDRDGDLWVGFWGGGVNRLSGVVPQTTPSGNEFSAGTSRLPRFSITAFTSSDGLCSDLILTMHQSRSGRLWFGADYDGGLSLRLTNGMFVDYRERMRERSVTPEAVRTMLDDRQENLWIGTRSGLIWHKGRQFRRYTTEHGLPSDSIESICEDRQGRIWFGTDGGLALLTNNAPFPALAEFTAFTVKDGLPNDSVTAIHEDRHGTLWLGTRGGLCRMSHFDVLGADKKKPPLQAYTAKDGLFRDEILSVVEDDYGFLWMSCRDGIFRVNKIELEQFTPGKGIKLSCQSFGKSDGMASVECKGSGRTAGFKSTDGRLWFPTSKGIVAVDPRQIAVNTESPRVFIEEVRVDGVSFDLSTQLRMIARKQKFTFTFTALDFSASEKVRFKCRLEGLDDDWIDVGSRREVHYGHIPAGEYRFHVVAAGSNGKWNEVGHSVQLTLLRPFWQTDWFLGLVCLGFAGLAGGTVRYVTVKKLKRRLLKAEQQHALEKERTRIAQDMHDELGSRLTEIIMLSEGAKKGVSPEKEIDQHRIAGAAREMAANLDAIVWAVEPRNDSLERVAAYLYDYVVQFLGTSSIRCRLDVPRELPSRTVTSETRHHLFMVIKEALNNIAKYAEATEIWFRLQLEDSALNICLEDNGKGFSRGETSASGNGLINMEKRIRAIGGHFDLESAPGKGTRIRIRIPLGH